MTLLLALLLADPLAVFEPLVGEQWIASSKLPNGEELRNRTVWSWGHGKRYVALRNFVSGKKGEVQRYETLVYRAKRGLVYQVFGESGLISTGTARPFEKGVALEQEAMESFPAMRTAYDIPQEGICRVRVALRGNKDWRQVSEVKLRRVELGRYKQLDLRVGASPLDALELLTGAWTWNDGERTRKATGTFRLNRALLHHVVEDGAEQFFSFDQRNGKPFGIEIAADGTVTRGPIEKVETTIIWTRDTTRDVFDLRTRKHRRETWKDGAWTLVGREWTGTRKEPK